MPLGENLPTGTARSGSTAPPYLRCVRHRFSYLLLSQFALIVLYPIVANDASRRGLYGMLFVAFFVAALYVVVGKGRVAVVAAILAVPAIGGNLLATLDLLPSALVPGLACGIAFMAFVTAVILWSILSTDSVTAETLYGAVSAYLLIGLTWGVAYFLIEQLAPGAFQYASDATRQITRADFLFFSFVTLTTLGYGDILPSIGLAKSLVIMEAVTGIMYPAVLIARLIGLHSGKSRQA